MAPPPKKDAFADLFSSANTSNRKKNLADLQRERGSSSSPSGNGMASMNGVLKPTNSGSVAASFMDEFDIFSGSNSSSGRTASATPTNVPSNGAPTTADDPFDIFNSISSSPAPAAQSQPQSHSYTPNASSNISSQHSGSRSTNEVNLLDDDFTDAFQPERQASPEPEPAQRPPSRTVDEVPVQRPSNKRDEIVAQLVDMGFPIEVSNEAVDNMGLDLQQCVNFIMSGGQKKGRSSNSGRSNVHTEDFGAKINDLSTDFFNKASFFLNKSKEAVIKNLEQFQQGQVPSPRRGGSPNTLPAWMQNQDKYKSQASERKPNGERFEDYGSDEENIDQESIRKFMEEQKARDKAKQKARMDNVKAMAREKITGASSSRSNSQSPVVPQRMSPQRSGSVQSQRQSIGQPAAQKAETKPASQPISQPTPKTDLKPDVDLLGLGGNDSASMTPAEKFKAQAGQDEVYVSSRRRRQPAKSATPKVPRKTTRETLDQFSQSDYDTSKEKASSSFTNGDYDDALVNYTKCLNALPASHELRVVINSNLAVTLIKLGNYKQARDHCNDGLGLISKEELPDPDYTINGKSIKSWYTKLLSRKAEALEMMESFPEALDCLVELVTQLGVNDKKVMDARRRLNNIVNPPPKPKPKPASSTVSASRPAPSKNNENLKRVQDQNKQQEQKDNLRQKHQEQVESKIFAWSNGKEDNLRSLLIALPDILPESLGFPFLTSKKITISDLMLPKKVKINYMKVISSIHPDKLANLNLSVEHEMLCQSVFITLNKSWDLFKQQNGIN